MGFNSLDDETSEYMETGDVPSFKIYDISEDTYYNAVTSNNYQWISMHPYNQSGGAGSNVHSSWTNGEWELHGTNNVHQYWSMAGRITFFDPMSSTRKTQAEWKTVGEESDRGQANIHNGYGQFLHMEEIKGFRIFPTSGTISAINYTLFGIIS